MLMVSPASGSSRDKQSTGLPQIRLRRLNSRIGYTTNLPVNSARHLRTIKNTQACIFTFITENKMPQLKLSYFDFDGGRAEPIRLALSLGNIPFEDHRFPGSEWPKLKSQTPLHQVPVMAVNGVLITESDSLTRYAGRLAGLYPEDPLEALHCDEAMATTDDIENKIGPTFSMPDGEEKRTAREALAAGPIPLFLQRLETMLKDRGGRYFAGNRLSVADFKVFLWIRYLQSGKLDHVQADIVQAVAPALAEHCARITALPEVAAYYQRRAAQR
jgi:glutathione S-transferase